MPRRKEPYLVYVECKGCNRVFDGRHIGGIQVMRAEMAQHARETGHELSNELTMSYPEAPRKRSKKE